MYKLFGKENSVGNERKTLQQVVPSKEESNKVYISTNGVSVQIKGHKANCVDIKTTGHADVYYDLVGEELVIRACSDGSACEPTIFVYLPINAGVDFLSVYTECADITVDSVVKCSFIEDCFLTTRCGEINVKTPNIFRFFS